MRKKGEKEGKVDCRQNKSIVGLTEPEEETRRLHALPSPRGQTKMAASFYCSALPTPEQLVNTEW